MVNVGALGVAANWTVAACGKYIAVSLGLGLGVAAGVAVGCGSCARVECKLARRQIANAKAKKLLLPRVRHAVWSQKDGGFFIGKLIK